MDRDQDILNYIQGRLGSEERAAFEAAMAEDASLAAEVEVMQSVRTELSSASKHERADAVWSKLETEISPVPKAANDNRSPWREILKYAAVALLSVGVWQFAIAPRIGPTPSGFETASEQAVEFTLQVKFRNSASIGEVIALLEPLDAKIADGPSALGILRLSFSDEQARNQALDALNKRAEIVELVVD